MDINQIVDFLERFQTLVVGALGFLGIIVTIATNAWLTRRQYSRQIKHEGDMLRVALRAELGIIRDAFVDRVNTLANAAPGHTSILIPLDTMTDAYSQLLEKIGLLSQDEIRAAMKAYLLVKQLPERMRLLQREHGAGVEKKAPFAKIDGDLFNVISQMHKNYLEDIEAALSALSE